MERVSYKDYSYFKDKFDKRSIFQYKSNPCIMVKLVCHYPSKYFYIDVKEITDININVRSDI